MPLLNEQQRQLGKDNYADALKISRRQMLAGTLAVPAAAGMYLGYDKIQGEPVRVGVIGTGDQGNNGHILPMNPDYCRLVAFCDIRPSNVKRTWDNINAKFGSRRQGRQILRELSGSARRSKHRDGGHRPAAAPARAGDHRGDRRHGKHVLCEKLMAHTSTSARR